MRSKAAVQRAVLGPQRLKPTLIKAVERLGVAGRICTITAGWQEREADDAELHQHLAERSYNLRLYSRAEQVFAEDPELSVALRRRGERLRQMQALYRVRLTHAMNACRALRGRLEDPELLADEFSEAIDAVRALDEEHVERCRSLHEQFERDWAPLERPSIARQRRELAGLIDESGALAIAGGHVAVLLNRLRLFGVSEWLAGKPLIAWSAGAMALCDRIVLFHDSPPQGAGDAELLEGGLGVLRGIVPLPHAWRRLRLDDKERVALFARRFAPDIPLALEDGAQLFRARSGWQEGAGVHRLLTSGNVEPGLAA